MRIRKFNEQIDEFILDSDIFNHISECFIEMLDNKSIRFYYDNKEKCLVGESYIKQKYDGTFNGTYEYLENCNRISNIIEQCIEKLKIEYDIEFRFIIIGSIAKLEIKEIIKK